MTKTTLILKEKTMSNKNHMSGVSVSVKTPDGKMHELPTEAFSIQNIQKPGNSTGVSGSVKHHISTKNPKTGSLMGVSMEISAWCTLECPYEHLDAAYDRAEQFVEEKIHKTQEKYIKSFNLEDWFGDSK
jgi:hypothetical protein